LLTARQACAAHPGSSNPDPATSSPHPPRQFCNKYIRRPLGLAARDSALITLGGYVAAWGWAFAAVTLAIAVLKVETERAPAAPPPAGDGGDREAGRGGRRGGKGGAKGGGAAGGAPAAGGRGAWAEVVDAYLQLWGVARLRPIWALSLLLVTYRLGVLPAEGAASLKLLDKGVSKEALAALVLFQFPVELVSAVVAGRCGGGARGVKGPGRCLPPTAAWTSLPCRGRTRQPLLCIPSVAHAIAPPPLLPTPSLPGGPPPTAPTTPSWQATSSASPWALR
jgi:hypothetical protein